MRRVVSLVMILPLLAASVVFASPLPPQTPSIEAQEESGIIVQAVGNVRLRSTPSLNGTQLALIGWGETAILLAVSEDGLWYQLNFNDTIGWAASEWFIPANEIPLPAAPNPVTASEPQTAPNPVVSGDVPAQTGVFVQAIDNVRLRTEPNINGERIGYIGWGDTAEVLQEDPTGGWYLLRYGNITGWAWAEFFVSADGPDLPDMTDGAASDTDTTEPDMMPAAPAQTEAPITAAVGTVVQSIDNVRIRNAPSINAARLSYIGWGETATLLGSSANGDWYLIEYQGVQGWVVAEFMQVVEGQAPPASVGSNATPASPESASEGASASAEVTAPTTSLPTGTVVQSIDNVRLRSQPNINSSRLGYIGWGETATLLGVDESGFWYLIEYQGLEGWVVAQFFVIVSGEASAPAPVADNSAAPTQPAPLSSAPTTTVTVPADATVVQAVGNVRLRAAPSLDAERIGYLGWGSSAVLLGTDPTGLWYQVRAANTTGWASAEWFVPVNTTTLNPVEGNPPAPVESAPPVAVDVAPPATAVSGTLVVAQDNVRLRSQPNINSARLGYIGWGETATLLGQDATGLWYLIDYQGLQGWVVAEFFNVSQGSAAVPTVNSTSSASQPAESAASASELPVAGGGGGAGASVSIPSLGVASSIVDFTLQQRPEGFIWYIDPMESSVGHLEGTARPGQPGHVVLAGHSELADGRPGVFGSLNRVRVGDTILVSQNGVTRRYVVTELRTVPFTEVSVVLPTPQDQLTLMTCTEYSPSQGIYLERLLIIAQPLVG